MQVGVLALQGDFREHQLLVESLDHQALKVRRPHELEQIDALLIPGGESTAISKLAVSFGMMEPLRGYVKQGRPVLGTCAGLILLADNVEGAITGQEFIGGLPITVSRNAYGGQTHSFEAIVDFGVRSEKVAFIRAPRILDAGEADIVASLNGEIVAVRHQNVWGASFHPEITGSTYLHELFLATAAG